MIIKRNTMAMIFIILILVIHTFSLAQTGSYDLSWNTFDGGGCLSMGGDYSLCGTFGQPDASSTLTGGSYSLTGGFWPGIQTMQQSPKSVNCWFFY